MNLHTAGRGARRWSDVGRGLVGLLGVLLLAAGVPAGLIAWVGWPLPSEVPSLEEIGDALRDTYIPDEFLIKALAVICWLVWVELMVALVVEAVAYAHGRQAGRVPLTSSGLQRAVARLVATAALLGALAATRGAPEIATRALSPPPADLVMAQPAGGEPAGADGAGHEAARPTPADHPIYEVQPRDTLWRIAECHLGDPFRWTEIYELNRGAPQPDGGVLQDADLIHPGWRLRLPADATGLGAPAAAPSTAGGGVPDPAPPAPAPAPPPGLPAGSDGTAGDMVLLDEGALLDGAPASSGELVATPGDGRSGGRRPSAGGRTGADPAGTRDTAATAPATAGSPDDPRGPATASRSASPDDDGGGMVLLPDGELRSTGSPSTDDWLVARGDE